VFSNAINGRNWLIAKRQGKTYAIRRYGKLAEEMFEEVLEQLPLVEGVGQILIDSKSGIVSRNIKYGSSQVINHLQTYQISFACESRIGYSINAQLVDKVCRRSLNAHAHANR
jgi:hypothetical protein